MRQLPKIDEVLKRPEVRALEAPRWAVVEAVRRSVDSRRQAILAGESEVTELSGEEIGRLAAHLLRPSLREVLNATGVILHTNLGRAPLGRSVLERASRLAGGYSNLEYDLDRGQRGSRHVHASDILRELTGAEDAVVVNNNAGAVLLCLAALAAGSEVIVSRGELIEIGGSFRIPDVMRLSGARLVEVGTTNKTHRRDYEGVIGENTALLLKVHRSNFEVVGFTAEVSLEELVEIGQRRGVPTMMDLGSGCLLEAERLAELGLPAEPSVRAVIASGLDVVTFSGDKLLGGPQAGVILGHRRFVDAVRSHPMMRALRPDKLTLSALTATLSAYRDGAAETDIPSVAMMSARLEDLRARAEELRREIGAAPEWLELSVVACESKVGGGAVPSAVLPSWGVALQPVDGPLGPDDLDEKLRSRPVPVIGRIADEQLLLDVRTLLGPEELQAVAAAVRAVFQV